MRLSNNNQKLRVTGEADSAEMIATHLHITRGTKRVAAMQCQSDLIHEATGTQSTLAFSSETANGFSQTFSGPSRVSRHTAKLMTDDRMFREINLRDPIGQCHFLKFPLIIVAMH